MTSSKKTPLPASKAPEPMWQDPAEVNEPTQAQLETMSSLELGAYLERKKMDGDGPIVAGVPELHQTWGAGVVVEEENIGNWVLPAPPLDLVDPIEEAVEMVADRCFTEADALGWHKDYEKLLRDIHDGKALEDMHPRTAADLQAWIVSKMFLVMGEVAEAGEELRNGRSPLEVYYSEELGGGDVEIHTEQKYVDGIPQYKPEGWLVEMADTLIRVCDLVGVVAGQEGVMFGPIVAAKLEYNATRGVMHGGKKF